MQKIPEMWNSRQLSESSAIAARGGASAAFTSAGLLLFGGASRDQDHFSDTWIVDRTGGETRLGEGPGERSGQAMTAAREGREVYLWGGLNFTQETVYNDAWKWSAGTCEWAKCKQLGDIPRSRNGHSLTVVQLKLAPDAAAAEFLMLFGGAGPESGPLSDSFVAMLSESDRGQDESKHSQAENILTWHPAVSYTEDDVAEGTAPDDCLPEAREMHGAASLGNTVLVTGGRSANAILDDVWALSPVVEETVTWRWTQRHDLKLPHPRCSHTSGVIGDGRILCVVGGFSGAAVLNDVLIVDLQTRNVSYTCLRNVNDDLLTCSWPAAGAQWQNVQWEGLPRGFPERFGHCGCVVTRRFSSSDTDLGESTHESDVDGTALIIFGGVNATQDLNDVWLLQPSQL